LFASKIKNNIATEGNRLVIRTQRSASAIAIAAALILTSAGANAATKSTTPAPIIKPDESTAVVSIIRRAVFMGDGWNYDVWEGDKYVGVLAAGTLLQHRAEPGEHVYLLMARGIHVWSYMKANLVAGKEYFARAYPIPFSLQAVDTNSDERVETWAAMKIVKVKDGDREKAIEKFGAESQLALAAYRNGEISPDCAAWFPPNKKGEKAKQPARGDSICRSIGDMKPEMGR
jgi:hypothetical protein